MVDEKDMKRLLKALSFAAEKHKDQRRKDVEASPYINHPISLATILCTEGHITDIEVICGALLHDTVEDTETTPEELEAQFGVAIRNIVMEVTDDMSLSRAERKRLQVEHASGISDKAKLVRLADKISNVRDVAQNPPADWGLERQQQYFDWAQQVINRVRGIHPGLERCFDAVMKQRPTG